MQYKSFLHLLLQYVILHNKYNFANAIIGKGIIRQLNDGEYSSVACLLVNRPEFSMETNTYCTAVFISTTHLLTSAHCLEISENLGFTVRAGSRDLKLGKSRLPMWYLTFTRWLTISDMTPRYELNDVGIIKITEAIDGVTPAPLSKVTKLSELYGEELEAVGCGLSNLGAFPLIKETATLHIISNNRCSKKAMKRLQKYVEIPSHYLCSRNNPFVLLALGDFGGPLFINGELVAINVGLTPIDGPLDDPKKSNLHISLAEYKRFIEYNLSM